MIRLISISLIALGSFLEIFYYIFRFTSGDGDNIYIAVTKGIALTLMLSGVTILAKKMKPFLLALSVLLVYSVLCTSAGQSMQYDTLDEKRTDEIYNTDPIIIQLENDISQLRKESKELTGMRTEISLDEKWKYEGVLRRTADESEAITEKIKGKAIEIEHRKSELITSYSKKDIYVFYKSLFQWPEQWIRFLFQTALSLFIALMAPFGIMLFDTDKKIYQSIPSISVDIIKDWVFYTWYLYRNKGSLDIPPDASIIGLMKKKHPEYTAQLHKKIKKHAILSGTIDKYDVIVYTNEVQAIKAILQSIGGK